MFVKNSKAKIINYGETTIIDFNQILKLCVNVYLYRKSWNYYKKKVVTTIFKKILSIVKVMYN